MASPNEITIQQLARLIGTPDCPVIIDVRDEDDYPADPRTIPTSQHAHYTDVAHMAELATGRPVIVTCQKGLKLSQGAAAYLRTMGIKAETLEGGHLAWAAASLPLVPLNVLPSLQNTLWVTRHRPKIDRIACPWLIHRFVDPAARFLFVGPTNVNAVAEKFGAIPFDIEGGDWSHKGETCTFDTMIDRFGLATPALDHLALIVRGADTNRHDLAPEAAGLLAASLGLSRMYRDDLEQVEAGLPLYDAFYRWARDATNEGHDWPATAAKGAT